VSAVWDYLGFALISAGAVALGYGLALCVVDDTSEDGAQ
jgi:hypothetical protein